MAAVIMALLLLVSHAPFSAETAMAATAPQRGPHLLVANVGNANVHCQSYVFKLCLQQVERRAIDAIEELRPDVIVLIEVMPDGWCGDEGSDELIPTKTCFGRTASYSQVNELLGHRYEYRCDERFGWDCVAVRRTAGRFVSPLRTAPAIPGCDSGFTVNRVDVRLRGGPPFQVLAGHPGGSENCLTAGLRSLLEMADPESAILAGDFNVDPYRESNRAVDLWWSVVGPGKRFHSHNDDTYTWVAEASQLDPTGHVDRPVGYSQPLGPLAPRTIDHVASDFLGGTCEIIRIDGGGGMDHRALDCALRRARRPNE